MAIELVGAYVSKGEEIESFEMSIGRGRDGDENDTRQEDVRNQRIKSEYLETGNGG